MSAQPPRTHARVVAKMLSLRAQPRRWRRLPRVVDLFAGAGGASWGATLAGCNVVAAVNHDATMLEAHGRAVPWAAHLCEDLERLNVMALPAHEVTWASIECTGHTRARGKEASHHDASRATAFCPVRLANYHRPRAVIVENVLDFDGWELLDGWLKLWECMKYRVRRVVLSGDHFGVPQERERVFYVMTLDTFAAPDLTLPRRVRCPTMREVVNLDTTQGQWSRWRDEYVPASVARIQDALAHQGGPCLVPYYGSESSHRGWSLDRPCGTLTRCDRYIVVVGELARVLTIAEQRVIAGFPSDYPLPRVRRAAVKALGASVIPACSEWLFNKVMEVIR